MMNVITSEFYKILRSKVFYVVMIVLGGLNVVALINLLMAKVQGEKIGTGFSMYQEAFHGEMCTYIILAFVACFITTEYANGSIRQMASKGIARWKLVVGQYIAISAIITGLLIVFATISLLIVTVLAKLGTVEMISFIRMNVGVICMFWGISGVATFLSYLFKNSGITIAVSLIMLLVGNYFVFILVKITNNDVFKDYTLSNMHKIITDIASKPEEVIKCTIVYFMIGVIAVAGSSLLFTKRDID